MRQVTRLLLLALGCMLLSACACGTPPSPSQPDAGFDPGDGGPLPPCLEAGLERCGGECVDLATDERNCGECGHACRQDEVCTAGVCTCPVDTVRCGEVCADLSTDVDHCGSCDTACAPGSVCTGGTCVEFCEGGLRKCGGTCADVQTDPNHCGSCGATCTDGRDCVMGACTCPPPKVMCDGQCVDLQADPTHCGSCNTQCFAGFLCTDGQCTCPPGLTACSISCVDTKTDMNNCGGCSIFCQPGQSCVNGFCETRCPPGFLRCNGQCVDPQIDAQNCGGCGIRCGALSCQAGACVACNSATTDCDNDGWTVADGDCCDQPNGGCGDPALVNPGALEVLGDGIDNNCNGLIDSADVLDVRPCDSGLRSNSTHADDYAKALGICRTTVEVPASPSQKTWGLISAQLLRADGTAVTFPDSHSIRGSFGTSITPLEGQSMVVLSSGIAADESQTNPGPNGGPSDTNIDQSSSVDIQNCTRPYCIRDWFAAPNPPLKLSNQLPEAPGCAGASLGGNIARDSVMLVLRLRAPTNVRGLQFHGYYLSSEYPEYVCTPYNDQFVALIDTPGGQPVGALNPIDKNLMTYSDGGQRWPIGVNMANGTSLFKVCETQAQNASCWAMNVSSASCAHGAAELAGTGFEASGGPGTCLNGGGTGWLTTRGNVRPGEIVELRIALWDAGDPRFDSLALLDGFSWLFQPAEPGTRD